MSRFRPAATMGAVAAAVMAWATGGMAQQPGGGFVPWREPQQGALTLAVPQGWTVQGGVFRVGPVDNRPVIEAASPDGRIRVFLGDPRLGMMEVPNAGTRMAGMRGGQQLRGAGGSAVIAPYQPAPRFAGEYIRAKCPNAQFGAARQLPDLAQQVGADVMRANAADSRGVSLTPHAAELVFHCGDKVGKITVVTVLAQSNGGVAMWTVPQIAWFVADPAVATEAEYITDRMIASEQIDPAWELRQQAIARQTRSQVIASQNAMMSSWRQAAAQQADALSRLNHPNPGAAPGRNAKEDARLSQQREDTTRGSHQECDPSGRCALVSNGNETSWMAPDGTVRAGPPGGGPPTNNPNWVQMSRPPQ